jgi:para-aminobenzoate synthetase / 4-amino-4-deoxychorismate lyase
LIALGCYTGARASGGRVWHLERHVERLVRDARLLGLGALDVADVRRRREALAAPTRGGPDRKLRLAVEPAEDGSLCWWGSATELGADGPTWSAITAPAPHPGASPLSSAQTTERAGFEAALAAARAAGADEALLCDAAGRLVEGARTNLVVALADGRLATPPLACGAQAGVARAIALGAIAELVERDVARDTLGAARELVAINAVRGARAIVRLDGAPIADGRPGRWAERLGRLLEDG